MKKKIALWVALTLAGVVLASCTDAEVAAHNVSKAADQFEVYKI